MFGLDQWAEVGDRLEEWKVSLRSILEVVKVAREGVESHERGEKETVDRRMENVNRGVDLLG